jgi:hypothetical protein
VAVDIAEWSCAIDNFDLCGFFFCGFHNGKQYPKLKKDLQQKSLISSNSPTGKKVDLGLSMARFQWVV